MSFSELMPVQHIVFILHHELNFAWHAQLPTAISTTANRSAVLV